MPADTPSLPEVVCRRQIAAHVAVWMSGTGPFLGFVTTVATGGLLWALAVVILEISCGVKLVLQKHVEAPFQRGDNGSALELIGLLRHVFVLVPLTVFLAYAAWVVEAAAICLASATVVTYYLVLQRAWPQGSLEGCVVLGALVFRSYDAYFQHQVASRVRQRLSNRPRHAD